MHSRWQNREELDTHINNWTQNEEAKELAERLQAVGVAATPVLKIPEIFETAQHKARDWWHLMTPAEGPTYHYYGPGWRLSETPVEILTPPPTYGQHNKEIYIGMLGLSEEEYLQLVEEKVISESQFPTLPPGMTLPATPPAPASR
jgi:crotonobetainyl-CoA:carnitine CoA-transferase CaiB-like acyl-CoA transferase